MFSFTASQVVAPRRIMERRRKKMFWIYFPWPRVICMSAFWGGSLSHTHALNSHARFSGRTLLHSCKSWSLKLTLHPFCLFQNNDAVRPSSYQNTCQVLVPKELPLPVFQGTSFTSWLHTSILFLLLAQNNLIPVVQRFIYTKQRKALWVVSSFVMVCD